MDIETLRLEAHYTALLAERDRMCLAVYDELMALRKELADLKAATDKPEGGDA